MKLSLFAILLIAALHPAHAAGTRQKSTSRYADQFVAEWQAYKRLFLAADGRIIDTFNNKISHSEGQGTGMLLAAAADDPEAFERIWNWTEDNLQRRDGLFYWKWDASTSVLIPDPNNATDGDILIAWALLRAGRKWSNAALLRHAQTIISSIETHAIETVVGRRIISPASVSFSDAKGSVLNLSYYIFPAIQDFAAYRKNDVWTRVYSDGLEILKAARFGRWQLPVDWIAIDEKGMLHAAQDWPPRFGYDAVRIPLYLIWARHDHLLLSRFKRYTEAYGGPKNAPSWWNSQTGASAQYKPENGVVAVRKITALAAGDTWYKDTKSIQNLLKSHPNITSNDDYYPASLNLLSRLAMLDLLERP